MKYIMIKMRKEIEIYVVLLYSITYTCASERVYMYKNIHNIKINPEGK